MALAAFALLILLLVFGRGLAARWARQVAAHRLEQGAISVAQQWLSWSARLDPDHQQTDLLAARCFRQLGDMQQWSSALQAAERNGAPAGSIQQEVTLWQMQSGQLAEAVDIQMMALIEAGVSPHEAADAALRAYVLQDDLEKAKRTLDAWAADYPESAHVAYMSGRYRQWEGEFDQAAAKFRRALAGQPRHEKARMALGELFEELHRLDDAFEQYAELATRAPQNEAAKVALARVLRKEGRCDAARAALESLASPAEPPLAVVAEMIQIELAAGNYEEVKRWFERVALDRVEDNDLLGAAANAFALQGNTFRAEQLFARIDAQKHASVRQFDLVSRLASTPHDRSAAEELQHLSLRGPPDVDPRGPRPTASASQLYAEHCSACHGADGDGQGRAARHLFPRPRDLRSGKMRLVSTQNGVASLADLEAVIRRGIPGTSMPSFEHLTADQRMALARETLRLSREGLRDQFVALLRDEGELVSESAVREFVELRTTPGATVQIPTIAAPDAGATARGRDTYFQLGCHHCHGEDGRGAEGRSLHDDRGRLTRPRDLVYEPLKGGDERESIYRRIALGMPGSPHPAAGSLTQQQLIELVHYCRSLSRQPKLRLTNHQRGLLSTSEAYLAMFGESPGK